MRAKLVESDLLECVLGLGPGLFYNSPMEACIVVCRAAKPAHHRRRVLFINAVHEVAREKALSFLRDEHIGKILHAYRTFSSQEGFAAVANIDDIRANDSSLSIALYVRSAPATVRGSDGTLQRAIEDWDRSSGAARGAVNALINALRDVPA